MRVLKQKYSEYLKDVSGILRSLNFDTTKQNKLLKELDETELIVPVVGGFSAGKSTLINSFLQNQILSTNITPETALATEIRYGESSYFEAVKANGESDKFEISQREEIKNSASKYKFLRLYLNNEKLKAIEPLVFVDMPDFDSPVELHNEAILSYLTKGKYFIVLISAEDGNVTNSVLREIENITEFGKGFTFCLSKSNLKSPSDVELIKQRIKEQLSDQIDYQKELIMLGDDGGNELDKILLSIDTKELFKSIFRQDLTNSNLDATGAINTTIATLRNSNEEAQNAIKELQQSIKKISDKKQSMLDEITSKGSSSNVESVANAVAKSIMNNVDTLAKLAISSQANFQNELNSIIKTTLVREIKEKINDVSSNLVDKFSIEMRGLNLSDF